MHITANTLDFMGRTYGQRALDRVVGDGRVFPVLTDLQNATGIAYSTLQKWKHGQAEPRFDQLERVATAARSRGAPINDVTELLSAEGVTVRPNPTDPLPERAAALAPFESDPDPIVQTAIRKTRALAFGGHRNRSTIEWTKRFLLEIELAREPFDEARNDAEVQALSDLVERNRRK